MKRNGALVSLLRFLKNHLIATCIGCTLILFGISTPLLLKIALLSIARSHLPSEIHSFSIGKAYPTLRGISIEDFQIRSSYMKLQGGRLDFDLITFLEKKEGSPFIHCEKPYIEVKKIPPNREPTSRDLVKLLQLFTISEGSFDIDGIRGQLNFEQKEDHKSAHFCTTKKATNLHVRMNFSEEAITGKATIYNFSFSEAAKLIEVFRPLQFVTVTGVGFGECDFLISPYSEFAHLSWDITVDDFKVEGEQFQAECKHLVSHASVTLNSEGEYSFVDALLHSDMELENGSVVVKDSSLSSISVSIHNDHVSAKGYFDRKQLHTPVSIEGHFVDHGRYEAYTAFNGGELSCALLMKNGVRSIQFAATNLPLESITPFIQDPLFFEEVEGSFSGEGTFDLTESGEWAITGEIQQLFSSMPIHFEADRIAFSGSGIGMVPEHAYLQVLQGKVEEIAAIEGELIIQNGVLNHSTLQGIYVGVPVHIELEQQEEDILLTASMQATIETVCAYFLMKEPQERSKGEITCELRLQFIDRECHVLGISTIQKEDQSHTVHIEAHIPEQLDQIRYTIQARDFPLSSVGKCIAILGEPWSVGGVASCTVHGTCETIEITSNDHTLSFESEHLDIKAARSNKYLRLIWNEQDNKWEGLVPITDAALFIKEPNLHFTSCDAVLLIDGVHLSVEHLDGLYHDFFFGGHVAVSLEDTPQVDIRLHTLNGRMEEFGDLLRHFEEYQDLQIPFNGEVSCIRQEGIRIAIEFLDQIQANWQLDFDIHNGSAPLFQTGELLDLSLHLSCASSQSAILLSKINAVLEIQSPHEKLIFGVQAPTIALVDMIPSEFDIILNSPTYDLFHFVGRYDPNGFLTLSDSSHLFGRSIQKAKLFFSESKISGGEFEGILSIGALEQLFNMRGLFIDLPPQISVAIDSTIEMIHGEIACKVSFNNGDGLLELRGINLEYGEMPLSEAFVLIDLHKEHWNLKRLTLGEIRASAEGELGTSHLTITRGECSVKEGAICIEGAKIDFDKKIVSSNGVSLHIPDVAKLQKLSGVTLPIHADFSARASVEANFSKGFSEIELLGESEIVTAFLFQEKIPVRSEKPMKISWERKNGLSIQEIALSAKKENLPSLWIEIGIEQIHSPSIGIWNISSIALKSPIEALCRISPKLEQSLEPIFQNKTITLNKASVLSIQADITKCEGYSRFQGLVEGIALEYEGTAVTISDIHVFYDGDDIKIAFECDIDSKKISSESHIKWAAKNPENLFSIRGSIAESHPSMQRREMRFSATWGEKTGLQISSLHGLLFGCKADLHHVQKEQQKGSVVLTGTVEFFPKELYLPVGAREFLQQIKLGKGVELVGEFCIDTQVPMESSFRGYLKGKDVEIGGVKLQTCMAELFFNAYEVQINNASITDAAGTLSFEKLHLYKGSDSQWYVNLPSLTLSDFRPSLLRRRGLRTHLKPFVIQEMVVKNIQGSISSPESLIGSGTLSFRNTFKESYHLLDLPFEIIARIGFDTNLLVPIKGKMTFSLHDGRIFITELKESYSEAKRSKFYLAKARPSSIGLDGSIDISIKMKQYVILKVTEPFILSINGTLSSPEFSLR